MNLNANLKMFVAKSKTGAKAKLKHLKNSRKEDDDDF